MTDFTDFGIVVGRTSPLGLQVGQFLFYGVAQGDIPAGATACLSLGTVPEGKRWIFYRIWFYSYDNELIEGFFKRSGIVLSRDVNYHEAVILAPSGLDAAQGDTVDLCVVNHGTTTRTIFIVWAAVEEKI